MSKMNWNRPNGGYEREPWNKTWVNKKVKPLQPVASLVRGHATHAADVRMMPWGPAIYCLECHKQITSISQEDYNYYRRTR